MPYKSVETQRKFQRERKAKRRSEWISKIGPCAKCGSIERIELDHIDPSTKVSHNIWSWSKQRMESELIKCQPLCYSCHKKKTKEDRGHGIMVHGKRNTYDKYGCRCDLCKKSNRDEARIRRDKKRKNGFTPRVYFNLPVGA